MILSPFFPYQQKTTFCRQQLFQRLIQTDPCDLMPTLYQLSTQTQRRIYMTRKRGNDKHKFHKLPKIFIIPKSSHALPNLSSPKTLIIPDPQCTNSCCPIPTS